MVQQKKITDGLFSLRFVTITIVFLPPFFHDGSKKISKSTEGIAQCAKSCKVLRMMESAVLCSVEREPLSSAAMRCSIGAAA
jgi:hypothetical protein